MILKEKLIKNEIIAKEPILNMEGISKTFSGVTVLNNVRIRLYPVKYMH
jgi:ribose transport system ATP-binding protein